MNLHIVKFYQDHYVPYTTEGTKHTRLGWVQTACPHCTGHSGEHLGFNTQFGYFNCWRCGPHPVYQTLAKLTGLTIPAVKKELTAYHSRHPLVQQHISVKRQQFKFPSGTGDVLALHQKYLRRRGYDDERLQLVWGEMFGTKQCAPLDGIDYKYRLLIPIRLDEQIVSFQARDITNKSKLRYMACPKSRELLDHKHTLYGLDQCKENKWVMVVEGIFDAWRMGPGTVATFGIEFTRNQVCRLVDRFEKAYIIYDEETQATKQARKLQAELESYSIHTEVFKGMKGDPDTFSLDDRRAIWQYISEHEKS